MKNLIRGVIFCALWYLSIVVGFYIFICPILPLVIISPKKYRRYSDLIFGLWEPFSVAMLEVCFGVRVALSGDKINPFEGSLFVMNHRTRVDWCFLWSGLYHCCEPNAHNIKYTPKASIMHLPGIGWVMQTCSFIFLYRDWSRDQAVLDLMIDYLSESDSSYQVLLFPEGTDKTERTMLKSHKYADEHNLDRYYYVLHPKTTGFVFLTNKMKSTGQLKAIYDVTIAYPKTMPQAEVDMLYGKFPEEVHFHVKRYSISDLPTENEDLKTWLTNIWHDKEKQLKKFYATGSFNATQNDASTSNDYDQEIDFGKGSMHNGIIKYDNESIMKKESTEAKNVVSEEKLETEEKEKPETEAEEKPETEAEEKSEAAAEEKSEAEKEEKFGAVVEEKPEAVVEEKPEAEKEEKRKTKAEEKLEVPTTANAVISDKKSSKNASKDRFEDFRPPYLLYLVLGFWIFLIFCTIYQLFNNFYLQIWFLTHSLLFASLSLVSNGFHHIAASLYLYRYKRKTDLDKKRE